MAIISSYVGNRGALFTSKYIRIGSISLDKLGFISISVQVYDSEASSKTVPPIEIKTLIRNVDVLQVFEQNIWKYAYSILKEEFADYMDC